MAAHERFRFRSLSDLEEKIQKLGVDIRLDEDLSVLARPVAVAPNLSAPNSPRCSSNGRL